MKTYDRAVRLRSKSRWFKAAAIPCFVGILAMLASTRHGPWDLQNSLAQIAMADVIGPVDDPTDSQGTVAGIGTGQRFLLVSSFQCPFPGCQYDNAVLRYDYDTGAFLGVHAEVTRPHGLGIHPLRETLYVVTREGVDQFGLPIPDENAITEFDALSGEYLRTVAQNPPLVDRPQPLIFTPSGTLLVSSSGILGGTQGGIFEFDPDTGKIIQLFVDGGPITSEDCSDPRCARGVNAMTYGPNGNLFVTSSANSSIIEYDAFGNFVNVFDSTKLVLPTGIAIRPNGQANAGNILVGSRFPGTGVNEGSVLEFNAQSRELVSTNGGVFANIALRVGPLGWAEDGNLLVGEILGDAIPSQGDRITIRNQANGAFLGSKTPPGDTNIHKLTAFIQYGVGLSLSDSDRNGNVDLSDFADLQNCLARGTFTCVDAFDDNASGSIGYSDYRAFAQRLTGPRLPCSSASDCVTGNPCVTHSCIAGSCVASAINEGQSCADDLFCNGEEFCRGGLCIGTNPCGSDGGCIEEQDICSECNDDGDCEDDNVCTDDMCVDGFCQNVNNTDPCDDEDACTQTDVCSNGACVGSNLLNCDDDNVCTDDSCDAQFGCLNINNLVPCDDGSVCTQFDQCLLGECRGQMVNCDDQNGCTADSCDPIIGCLNIPNVVPCSDGDPCTQDDRCINGICRGDELDCEDFVSCTIDSCVDGVCVNAPSNELCDDGLFCNGQETCNPNFGCEPEIFVCDDGIDCTDDSCNEDFESCVHTPNNSLCDDDDPCTLDQCDQSNGCFYEEQDCSDFNECTDDECVDGECMYVNNTAPCNDNDPCTIDDICGNGSCNGAPVVCPGNQTCDPADGVCKECITDQDCDDGNPCTNDTCDNNACVSTNNMDACDDGDNCTENDICAGGACAGTDVVCNAGEVCDPADGVCKECLGDGDCNDDNLCTDDTCESGTCVFTNNTEVCDDADNCTENDVCAGGSCAGTDIVCNPGATCDPADGICKECVVDEDCTDGNVCTDDACVDNACVFTDNSDACDDGDNCTENDVCAGGTCAGSNVVCDSGQTCDPTDGVCKECLGDGDCDDGNPCTDDACVANLCEFTDNTEPCDDGDNCTENDVCSSGTCAGSVIDCGSQICDPADGVCKECLGDGDCSDGNPCTDDACVNDACEFTNNVAACDDGDNCTENDVCAGGTCAGAAIVCDSGQTCDPADGVCKECLGNGDCNDNDVCTDDACVDNLCVFTDNTAPCDDNDNCTENDACSEGSCAGAPVVCDQGQVCDPADGACKGCLGDGDCDDGNVCTDDACVSNECEFTNNTDACDDGDNCTENDACAGGGCAGTPVVCDMGQTCDPSDGVCKECLGDNDCDDGNACTDDACTDNACVFTDNSDECDDGDNCTENDVCNGGSCAGSAVVCPPEEICDPADGVCKECLTSADCDDGNVCTDESCDSSGTCVFTNNTAACDDGDNCTDTDVCAEGSCAGSPVVCGMGQVCDPADGSCKGCLGDGDCNDGNPCTDDACVNNDCEYTNNTDSCDDSDNCTENDVCTNGACVGEAVECTNGEVCDPADGTCKQCITNADCDDGNECTAELCSVGRCFFANLTTPCDDGDNCTENDTCSLGSCSGTTVVCGMDQVCDPADGVCKECLADGECDDGDLCTDDTCVDGTCTFTNNTSPCDDGDPCTELDECLAGSCGGTPVDCGAGEICDPNDGICKECLGDEDCDDGNECTDDTCDAGTCVITNNASACDDGDNCTENDVCAAGSCAGSAVVCNAGETCDPADGVCKECLIDADCDDGDVCTDDTCAAGVCMYANNIESCDDGDNCTENDACLDGTCSGSVVDCSMQICDPADGVCKDCLINADCDDGDICTDDSCDAGVCVNADNTVVCDDGDNCTENDSCAGGVCAGSMIDCGGQICDPADGVCKDCLGDADCDDSDICTDDTCDAGVCVNANNAVACDDGDNCTDSDACSGGVCSGMPVDCGLQLCDPTDGVCKDCLVDADCDDGDICTDDTCDAGTCVITNNTAACDDGDNCTENDACAGGSCAGSVVDCGAQLCDPADGFCKDCLVNADCDDGDICTDDTCDAGVCMFTDNNASCDDMNNCTENDACDAGTCAGSPVDCGVQLCDPADGFCKDCLVNTDCDDSDDCTDDTCDAGSCVYTDNTAACDDGDNCTELDSCDGGVCAGTPVVCGPTETCDPSDGVCKECLIDADCDDDNVCTTDTCEANSCVRTNNMEPCDDGVFCNGTDTCMNGTCSSHSGDPCGSGTCNETSGGCD